MHSGGLGLLISKAEVGTYVAVANDSSNMFPDPESKFTSSKSNSTVLYRWHVISVMWSDKKNLSNCWSNGIKIITFTLGDAKGSDYSCLTDTETSHIHQYLMKKWEI